MPLKVGDTFLMGNTGGVANPTGAHLMVCIVVIPDGNAVIVPIVSMHDQSDDSCVLKAGDHPFIKHDSCASYDFARIVPASVIDGGGGNADLIKQQAALSNEIITRLQVGFVKSDETLPWLFTKACGPQLEVYLKHKGYL